MLTDAQVRRTLEMALGWLRNDNVSAAHLRLAALRSSLRGEQREFLDAELRKHKQLLARVLKVQEGESV